MADLSPEHTESREAEVRAYPDSSEKLFDLHRLAAKLATRLGLKHALTFLDLETTGLNIYRDRIVELAFVRIEPEGAARSFTTLINPTTAIPIEATRVHGICDDDVVGAPTFVEIAPTVLGWLSESDFGGYNLTRFDLPLLRAEFERAGHSFEWEEARIIDACMIFKRMERRDLANAYRFYCAAEFEGAHAAGADVRATIEVMLGQLDHYPSLPNEVELLDALCRPYGEPER